MTCLLLRVFFLTSQLMTEEIFMSVTFSVVALCLGVPSLCSCSTIALTLPLYLVNSCLVRSLSLLIRIIRFFYENFLIWATSAHSKHDNLMPFFPSFTSFSFASFIHSLLVRWKLSNPFLHCSVTVKHVETKGKA